VTKPPISVVIAVRDGARFIRRAIDSARAQTLAPAELLIVDDGSTDGTSAVLDEIEGLRRLGDGRNRGQSAALNMGVAESRQGLIAFLDADDVWMPDKLARQVAVLEAAPDLEAVFGHARERVDVPDPRFLSRDGRVLPARLPSALLIRRAAWARVGPLDETLRIGAPVDWYARARARGLREHLLADVVYERHIHGANLGLSAGAAEAYFTVVRRQVRRLRSGGG
jgi:glycosyltransferase involved in cell wall biosynthesis